MTLGPAKDGAATGPRGKFAASASFLYRKIIFPFIPICMSPGSLKDSVADTLCRSERNKRFHDGEITQLHVGRCKSETSSITIIDRSSLEERLRNLESDPRTEQVEPVVALSVHGWARGHERNVVEALKRGLRAARIVVHEIVSPADVLVMFHDMTMGMNVEHLLGRMRHAAAYSNAQDVVLVLMEAEKPRPSKNGNPHPVKFKGREKVGERSWHMLCAAASLVVEYSYLTTDGSNQIHPHNEGALAEIVNHVCSWVSGRDSIGMSVECSHQAAVELGGGVRNTPTISLGGRAVGTVSSCGGGPVHLSSAAIASARMQGMNSATLGGGSRDSFGSLLDSCVSISESDVPVVVSASSRHGVSVDNVVGVSGGVPPIEEHVPLMGDRCSMDHTAAKAAVSHSLTNGRGYSAGTRKQDASPSSRSLSWSGWDLSKSDLPQGSRGSNSPEKAAPPRKSVTAEGVDGGHRLGMRVENRGGTLPRNQFLMGVGSEEIKRQGAAQPNKKGVPVSSGKRENEMVKNRRHEKKSTLPRTDVATGKHGRVQKALSQHPNVRDVGGAFEMDIG
ncbi:hypothetical protein BSKO_04766 [Bryopsis sp. KO-2023]|nr:hypothetical protein BSKO_04766 [Bryopsis sp. KO-2023]